MISMFQWNRPTLLLGKDMEMEKMKMVSMPERLVSESQQYPVRFHLLCPGKGS